MTLLESLKIKAMISSGPVTMPPPTVLKLIEALEIAMKTLQNISINEERLNFGEYLIDRQPAKHTLDKISEILK